ncbi:toll/interleukin-1 receptor domain-containing protein [Burkholderia pseudomallei]|nr:toll/interleukin-1 receptor domain-containing protein [Burkholderia pseudomallei]MBF3602733.1 toll/interleukin-1 receptor domain-containing protein [Burkholderia pseudomallei]
MKDTIFISHATPEDNAFTRWLGSKLELAGYKVWHDLARLKGGDIFWEKIESAIRNDSFRFLAVVSTVAVGKSGVKDEWAVAATIEKSLPGFVIPLRIDHFDFQLFPITIHRKNAIDFANGWHKGLASLLDTLEEVKVPKVSTPDPALARHWLAEMKEGAILRTEQGRGRHQAGHGRCLGAYQAELQRVHLRRWGSGNATLCRLSRRNTHGGT